MNDPYAPPQGPTRPREPTLEDQRGNNMLGLALFGAFLLLFVGTAAVAFVYLALD